MASSGSLADVVAMDTHHDSSELLSAWRAGDRKAGDALIRSAAPALQRFFVRKVGKGEQAEELVQRTQAACVTGIQRFRGDSSFRTWLLGVANNVLRDYFRETRHRHDVVDAEQVEVSDTGKGPTTLVAASQEQQRVIAALRRISADSQQLLERCYWQEQTVPEIAEALGVPVGTMRGRVSKAKLELRGELDAMERQRERLDA
jgi:RNA polymerase sigma-70 factor (ECF subfamily)